MDKQPSHIEDEVTLKEIILKVQEFYSELKKKWLVILLFVIPIAFFMGYKAHKSTALFEATVTFMVSEDDGGSMLGALSGVLGNFGLGKKSKNNLDRILALSKSMKIAQRTLFAQVEINGNKDYIANHIIDLNDSLGKWEAKSSYKFWQKPSDLKDFRFKSSDISQYGENENKALKKVYRILTGSSKKEGAIISSYDGDTGIMSISGKCGSEDLSYHLATSLFEKLSKYYVDKTTERQSETFALISSKHDSIANALKSSQFALAKFEDENKKLFSRVNKLKEKELKTEVQKLLAMYAESAKNREFAEFTLLSQTPYIQAIDYPIRPLGSSKESLFKNLFLGAIIGFFLGAFFVLSRKIYRDAISS